MVFHIFAYKAHHIQHETHNLTASLYLQVLHLGHGHFAMTATKIQTTAQTNSQIFCSNSIKYVQCYTFINEMHTLPY